MSNEIFKSNAQLVSETLAIVEAFKKVSAICEEHEQTKVHKVIDMEQVLKDAQHVDCICVDGVILTKEELHKMVAG